MLFGNRTTSAFLSTQIKSTLRLPGLKAGACFRLERSTEITPKSHAEGLGAVERVNVLGGDYFEFQLM